MVHHMQRLDDVKKTREKQSKKKTATLEELDCVILDELDCVILDGDPNKAVAVGKESVNESDDVVVVAEKGQIACRDYPHARHLCVTFPFSTNPHDKYCDLCHCYVCDTLAPCVYWGTGKSSDDHCHSSDKEQKWIKLRQCSKQGRLAKLAASGRRVTTLPNEPPLRQSLNVNEDRVVLLELLSLSLDRSAVQGDRFAGTVKWFDSHKGYGFITLGDGGEDLFVHHSSILSAGHKSLADGERVEFDIELDDDGRINASNVSGPGGLFVKGTRRRDSSSSDCSTRTSASYGCGEYGRNKDADPSSHGGFVFQGITRRDNYGNCDSDVSECYNCGKMGHSARHCNSEGGSNHNNFRGRVDHGGGGRASDSNYRGDYGAAGVGSRRGSFLQENSRRDNYSNGSNHRVRDDRGGGSSRYNDSYRRGDHGVYCGGGNSRDNDSYRRGDHGVDRGGGRNNDSYRHGDYGRNGATSVGRLGQSFSHGTTRGDSFGNNDSETRKCYKCGEKGHCARNCDGGVGGNGFNRSDTFESYNRSNNWQRDGCSGGTNSRYSERNRAASTRSPSRNLTKGNTNTRGGNNYGERGNSVRDCLSMERGAGGCYSCGGDGHFARECPSRGNTNTRGGNKYEERGNSVRDCHSMERGAGVCYICGGDGHFARECPDF